ncbi:glycoside hydrolase family 3 protein [Actinoplanes sp. N902-109]|uniref:glycoside hydrolase family 3 protein n=1 Tax=Actinoplanes sp. (strain N902-109) TaxID=649831 RepID=UPI0003294A17|nr:glycoside hydrolase family 3 protein [Actinoplanes sp. N902-109]AGL17621.1 family 3 glycoside hydrolase domain-containing protein [Actinoplanes sp. N902-109]
MRTRFLRRGLAALTLTLLTLPLLPGQALAATARAPEYPFRDPRLPLDRRVDDLIGRLTLDEKISLLHQYQPAIPRLGIKLFKAGTEALHGVAWSNDIDNGGAVVTANGTSFPQPVGMASTWDPHLIKQVGSVVGDEARGYHQQNERVFGLNLWAPVVNLLRDPRWGRNEEGYSEDPLLTGEISTAYGAGLMGDDPRHIKTAPTLKHYLAYNNEQGRDVTSSNVPQRVLNEYDRAAFKPALTAGAATGVMASYNLVNGRPATVDPDLGTLVRSWSDKPLFNVSDAYAPYNLTGSQQYYATQPEADAAVIKAGLDSFTVDDGNGTPTVTAIKTALTQGLLTERDIDAAAGHAVSIRFRLGEFDPDGGPYAKIGTDVINAPAHQALARETAADAAVLLKNDRNALPLASGKKVAVVGPLGDVLYSDWYGAHLPYQVTVADGIRERAASVTTSEGSDRIALKDVATGRYVSATGSTDSTPVTASATTAAANAQFDLVDWGQGVVTLRNVGTGKYLGYNWGPFITRDDQPNGWYVQQQFKLEAQSDGTFVLHYAGYETTESWFGANTYVTVGADGALTLGSATAAGAAHFTKQTLTSGIDQAVAAAKSADTAVVVVGSMPFINGREAHDRTTLALAAGQQALIKAVLAANPHTVVVLQTSYPDSITWEQQHVPALLWTTHAGAETGHGVADVLFGSVNPAGRLTQTWPRSDDQLPADLNQYDIISTNQTYLYSDRKPLYPFGHGLSYTSFRYSNLRVHGTTVTVDVTNTGKRAGDEVVQLYTHQRTSRDKQPRQELRAFQRVSVQPGRTTTVSLRFDRQDLAHWDVTRQRWVVESATHDVLVGSSSADIRARGTLRVRGETIPARDLTRTTRAEAFDGYAGVRLVDQSKARGTAVGSTADGQWISFRDARFGRTLTATVAKETAGTGTIQVRQGSPTGKLLGTARVASTGSRYTYATTSAPVAAGHGDLYLVLSSGIRIADVRVR